MTTVHDTFTLERHFNHPPARVYGAFADPELKQRWFVGPADWKEVERTVDVRPGGREVVHGRFGDGKESRFVATYHVVEKDQRLVYAYDMYVSGALMSVSLVTIEVSPERGGTRLRLTEQGAFVDGSAESAAGRKQGTEWLLEKVEQSL